MNHSHNSYNEKYFVLPDSRVLSVKDFCVEVIDKLPKKFTSKDFQKYVLSNYNIPTDSADYALSPHRWAFDDERGHGIARIANMLSRLYDDGFLVRFRMKRGRGYTYQKPVIYEDLVPEEMPPEDLSLRVAQLEMQVNELWNHINRIDGLSEISTKGIQLEMFEGDH